jgi:hypothetical protein
VIGRDEPDAAGLLLEANRYDLGSDLDIVQCRDSGNRIAIRISPFEDHGVVIGQSDLKDVKAPANPIPIDNKLLVFAQALLLLANVVNDGCLHAFSVLLFLTRRDYPMSVSASRW